MAPPLRRRQGRGCAVCVRWLVSIALLGLLVSSVTVANTQASAPAVQNSVRAVTEANALTGMTRDALGRLLANVEIVFAPAADADSGDELVRVRSDESGRFEIPDLTPGLYRVVAVKGGYEVVVGQINTVVQASLDLILFPTGREKTDPASAPVDASWALRLPQRDALEEQGPALPRALAGGDAGDRPAPARPPLHLALTHRRLENDASPRGAGLGLDLYGALPLGDLGNLGLDIDYARLGRAGQSRDDNTLVSLGWIAPGRQGVDSRVDALGARSERASVDTTGGRLDTRLDRYALRAERMLARPGGGLELGLSAESLDAEQQLDPSAGAVPDTPSAQQAVLSAELRGEWSAEHASRVRLEGTYARGYLLAGEGGDRVLMPGAASRSMAVLDHVDGTSARLDFEHRQELSRSLSGAVRTSAVALPGAGRGVVGASTIGMAWRAAAGTEIRAEAGGQWGGASSGSAVWRLELAHVEENWDLRVGRSVESGAMPWASDVTRLGQPLLVTDHDGRLEVWSIATTLSPDGSWWPTLALTGEVFSAEGRIAAHLHGDVPIVPIDAGGRAEGRRVRLDLTLARLGTMIEVSWEGVDDLADSRELLGGAGRYTRRGVNVRQRLGMIEWYGTNCYLMVGVVEQDLEFTPFESLEDPGRLAFLDQRRFSGGLAVAF